MQNLVGTHTEGHSVQMGQHVRASSTKVSASSRETAAVLNPTAKGSAIANSISSQLLSCTQTLRHSASLKSFPAPQTTTVVALSRTIPCAAVCAAVLRLAARLQQYT